MVTDGAEEFDSGFTTGTVLSSGGIERVYAPYSSGVAPALAEGAVVYGGGQQLVSAGSIASGTRISSGGVQRVDYQGMVSGTVISSGGQELNISGGSTGMIEGGGGPNSDLYFGAVNDTVLSGGVLDMHADAWDDTVSAGGVALVTDYGGIQGLVLYGKLDL